MRKRFLLCGLMAIAAVNFISCDDEDENNDKKVENPTNNGNSNGGTKAPTLASEFISASGCLGSAFGDTLSGDQTLAAYIDYKYDASKGEMMLNLNNVILTCSAIPKMDVEFNGDTLIVKAYDANIEGPHADCLCRYDMTSKVTGVQSKVYYIRNFVCLKGESEVLELPQKSEGVIYLNDIN